jgi:endogenous inhibitor of DNA gyrase (YacG/DUF329 family)
VTHEVECPTCGKAVAWIAENKWRPFCSERCKLVDLGDWAAERRVIPGNQSEATSDDVEDDPGSRSRGRH